MRTRPERSNVRLADDRGAVVVEAALVLPLIMVFVAGIVDFGMGLRDRTIIQSVVRNGARVGASAVNDPTADQLALSTMYAGLNGAKRIDIKSAIVFEANTLADGEPTASCRSIAPIPTGTGNAGANCNVYAKNQILSAAGIGPAFVSNATCAAPAWNRYWCASVTSTANNERTADLTGSAGGVDSLGLYVKIGYSPFTGVFGTDELIMTDSAVMRLEPSPG